MVEENQVTQRQSSDRTQIKYIGSHTQATRIYKLQYKSQSVIRIVSPIKRAAHIWTRFISTQINSCIIWNFSSIFAGTNKCNPVHKDGSFGPRVGLKR